MRPERELQQTAARQLEAAGYYVEQDALPNGNRSAPSYARADLLAWAGTEDGETAPEVVVEVKTQPKVNRGDALAQLSRIAAVAGARRAFFFDGHWHEADPTFTRLNEAGCPQPVTPFGHARAPKQLIERELSALRDRLRSSPMTVNGIDWIDCAAKAAELSADTPLSRLCTGSRSRFFLARMLSASPDEFGIPIPLADAMVRLLAPGPGITVLDPACGVGGSLLAVAEASDATRLQGWCSNDGILGAARTLGGLSGCAADFVGHSFDETLGNDFAADSIISVLPFGVRLRERARLADGSMSNELDVALLDRITRWLKPGGRAVVAVAPRLLFSATAESLRKRLAREFRVVSIIELPAGIFQWTKIRVAIVVLENKPPTETLVARLSEDWTQQLSSSGQFLAAFRRHLE